MRSMLPHTIRISFPPPPVAASSLSGAPAVSALQAASYALRRGTARTVNHTFSSIDLFRFQALFVFQGLDISQPREPEIHPKDSGFAQHSSPPPQATVANSSK
ncbi:hypothetical protein CTheo_15 [Ceratobasidium theobromae]|uniref:Uncharacterized protein n=1 Tax=Ceratobasidium theobromae TaxID=1582974 RepID=A0A5N5QXG9_9AGAM|nr:hypothetical protein CTheo_15 [Ceratobasidium theobromae]